MFAGSEQKVIPFSHLQDVYEFWRSIAKPEREALPVAVQYAIRGLLYLHDEEMVVQKAQRRKTNELRQAEDQAYAEDRIRRKQQRKERFEKDAIGTIEGIQRDLDKITGRWPRMK